MIKEIDRLRSLGKRHEYGLHTDDFPLWLKRIEGRRTTKVAEENKIPERCVYCHARWTPQMVSMLVDHGDCDTCGYMQNTGFIACSECGKIVYKKWLD